MVLGMNGVAMARHGLILWENEATGSRKVSKYLPGLRDAVLGPKNVSKTTKQKKTKQKSMNGAAMARHGLILWENEATSLGIIFKCLLGLRGTI